MAYQVKRLEQGIYFTELINDVTFADFQGMNERYAAFAQEDSVGRYVVIVDAAKLRKFPTDVRGIQGAVPSGVAAYMLMNAPKFAEIVARIIGNVNHTQKIELVKSVEEGLTKARPIMVMENLVG